MKQAPREQSPKLIFHPALTCIAKDQMKVSLPTLVTKKQGPNRETLYVGESTKLEVTRNRWWYNQLCLNLEPAHRNELLLLFSGDKKGHNWKPPSGEYLCHRFSWDVAQKWQTRHGVHRHAPTNMRLRLSISLGTLLNNVYIILKLTEKMIWDKRMQVEPSNVRFRWIV